MTLMLRPVASLSIKADLMKMHNDAVSTVLEYGSKDLSRLQTIRASQLPFCPLNYVLSAARGGPHMIMGYHMAYFTSVGTTVHEVMQRFHGKSGKFLADWQCPKCKEWRRMSHRPMCCGVLGDYHEIIIKLPWVVGHIDGVYQDRDGSYWIVDYKTTSTAQIANGKADNPGRAYTEQVEAYAWAMGEQYNIRIKGVSLMFIIRDNPTTPHIWAKELDDKDFNRIGKRLERYTEQHKKAYLVQTKDHLKWAWKNRLCMPTEIEDTAPMCLFKRGCEDSDPTEAIAWFEQGVRKGYMPVKRMVERQLALKAKE